MNFAKRFLLLLGIGIALGVATSSMLVQYATQPQISASLLSNRPLSLLLNTNPCGIGGAEVHSVYATKALNQTGRHVALLVTHNRPTHHLAVKEQIPVISCRAGWAWHVKPLYRWLLKKTLQKLAALQPLALVQCSTEREAAICLRALGDTVPVILEQHHQKTLQHQHALHGLTAAIGVSKKVAAYLADANRHYHLGMRHVVNIAPFFDQKQFMQGQSNLLQDRAAFFAHTFGITLQPDAPVISCIAHMRSENKNQDLLLKAAKQIITLDHIPLNIILVGEGPRLKKLGNLAAELGIQDHVFFTGFTNKAHEILWHSDLHVLPSKAESYGLVHVEAALMGKVSVGARGTGAEEILLNRKTGMLFANNNQQSLYEALHWLITHSEERKKMGQRAKKRALKHFTNQQKLERLIALHNKLITT